MLTNNTTIFRKYITTQRTWQDRTALERTREDKTGQHPDWQHPWGQRTRRLTVPLFHFARPHGWSPGNPLGFDERPHLVSLTGMRRGVPLGFTHLRAHGRHVQTLAMCNVIENYGSLWLDVHNYIGLSSVDCTVLLWVKNFQGSYIGGAEQKPTFSPNIYKFSLEGGGTFVLKND